MYQQLIRAAFDGNLSRVQELLIRNGGANIYAQNDLVLIYTATVQELLSRETDYLQNYKRDNNIW